MQPFVHRTPSSRVVFGPGCIHWLGAELGRLGLQRPLVLSGRRTAAGHKLLFSDAQLAARLVLIDPEANRCVPAALMLATGMNGRAHCLAGLDSKVRTAVSTALALHGTALFFRALPAVADALADALVNALHSLRTRLGVPSRLRDQGLTRQQLGPVAAQVMHERGRLYFNPRPVAHAGKVEQLLARAW